METSHLDSTRPHAEPLAAPGPPRAEADTGKFQRQLTVATLGLLFVILTMHVLERCASRADARFLVAYNYVTCGYPEAAVAEVRQVCKAQPKVAVAAELLRTIAPEAEKPATAVAADVKPIPPEHLVGTWTATGSGKAKYSMTLAKDGTFLWTYEQVSRMQQVKGVYAVEGSSLVPDSYEEPNDEQDPGQPGAGAGRHWRRDRAADQGFVADE